MVRRAQYNPRPLVRKFLLREADKIRGTCDLCRSPNRPLVLNGKLMMCGPCHYGTDILATEAHTKGKLCGDCAFRQGSPERENTEEYMQFDVMSELDFVKQNSNVFYCHKPFLAPEQEWGYSPKIKELIPLYGEHWRACEGWWAEMRRQHPVQA